MLKNKRLLKVIAVLTVMVMSIFMLTGCGNKKEEEKNDSNTTTNTYEDPIKNVVEGVGKANISKFMSAYPSFIAENINQIIDEDYLQSQLEDYEDIYGNNIEMSYSITNKEEISEEDLKEEEEELKDTYDEDVDITKGYNLEVELKIKGDEDEDTEEDSFEVYEINGTWYLLEL